MTGDQTASLIYLLVLATAIASYYLISGRASLGRSARHAALWFLIFIGVIVAYGLWEDVRSTVIPTQSAFGEDDRIEVPLGRDGHYHMVLHVNGQPVQFVVDTGASDIVLSREDAARVGIDVGALSYLGSASTANGVVRTARVWLDEIALGPVTDRRVAAVVNQGEMAGSLLGMSYLNRFSQVNIGGGKLVLMR
ncbi:retropepsin-like aspartic protease family protein [Tropicimonas sp.]|uniref:retropepsin-like aspartic protease family protein n=1 Tax=Tropicimonas sp. TaxID=2067044 RepID=UPI003A898E07